MIQCDVEFGDKTEFAVGLRKIMEHFDQLAGRRKDLPAAYELPASSQELK